MCREIFPRRSRHFIGECHSLNLRAFIRARWWELRTGAGNYLSMAATFVSFILLISIRFNVTGATFPIFVVIVFFALASSSVLLGHVHKRWQQDTDARLTIPDSRVEDIANRVIEKLEEKKKLG